MLWYLVSSLVRCEFIFEYWYYGTNYLVSSLEEKGFIFEYWYYGT